MRHKKMNNRSPIKDATVSRIKRIHALVFGWQPDTGWLRDAAPNYNNDFYLSELT